MKSNLIRKEDILMNNNLKRELELFQKLSTEKDYELITSEVISFQDYQRLSYIINKLNLMDLDIYFFTKHHDRFEKLIKQLDNLDKEYEPYIDVDLLDDWLKTFAENISDEKDKDYILNQFGL